MKRSIRKRLFDDNNSDLNSMSDNNIIPNTNSNIIMDAKQASRAFFSSVRRGDLKKTRMVLELNNIDINATNYQGVTGLSLAVTKNNLAMMELLLDKGADINRKTTIGDTPLSAALGFCNTSFARFLIERGAYVDNQSPNGESPLHTATRNGQVQVVEMLLERNANIEAVSKDGLKALDIGIINMHFHTTATLIFYGAKITRKNVDDVIVQPLNLPDLILSILVTTASMFDHIYDAQTQQQYDCKDRIHKLYNDLDQSCQSVLASRLLYQVFWNKTFTAAGLKAAAENLIVKVNYLNDKIGLEVSSARNILMTYYEHISSQFLSSEEGVPSLFRQAAVSLKQKGLWEQKLMKKDYTDIVDRANLLEKAYEFLKKFHITLQSKEEGIDNENAHLSSDNFEDFMELAGKDERWDFMDIDWDFGGDN